MMTIKTILIIELIQNYNAIFKARNNHRIQLLKIQCLTEPKLYVQAILELTAPTMLMHVWNYLNGYEIDLEINFPVQFPFGSRGSILGEKHKVGVCNNPT